MAFIRKKLGGYENRNEHYYLVENKRTKQGKIRQKVLVYLGPCSDFATAVMHFKQMAAYYQKLSEGYRHSSYPEIKFEKIDMSITPEEKQKHNDALKDCRKWGWSHIQIDKRWELRKRYAKEFLKANASFKKYVTKCLKAMRRCEDHLATVDLLGLKMSICNCRECQHARECFWLMEKRPSRRWRKPEQLIEDAKVIAAPSKVQSELPTPV